MKSLTEVRQHLKAYGFEELGSADIMDSRTYFFAKRIAEDKWEVAIVDGWLGDWTPRIRTMDTEKVEQLKARIRAEGAFRS
jgi:hypothetical protein